MKMVIVVYISCCCQGKAGADGGGSAVKKMRLNTTTAPGHHSDVQVGNTHMNRKKNFSIIVIHSENYLLCVHSRIIVVIFCRVNL